MVDINNINKIELTLPAIIWIVSIIICVVHVIGMNTGVSLFIPWITPISWIASIGGFLWWIAYLIWG